MQEYKIFWKAKEGLSFGEFTTETVGRRTTFRDANGKDLSFRFNYELKPTEEMIDRTISRYATLDAAKVYSVARAHGAEGGIGIKDLRMSKETTQRIEEEFGDGLRLVTWEDYSRKR